MKLDSKHKVFKELIKGMELSKKPKTFPCRE